MARPAKPGLDYFPKDIGFYAHRKICRLNSKYGAVGIIIYDFTLSIIYGEKGYYIEYSKDLEFDICYKLRFPEVTEELVSKVLAYCLEVCLFNVNQYQQNKILTSTRIQKTYNAVKKRDIIEDIYRLIPQKEAVNELSPAKPHIKRVITPEPTHKAQESTQSKVKESKVKERKVYFFKIKNEIIKDVLISEYIEENHQISIDQYLYAHDSKKIHLPAVFSKLDSDYAGYSFTDDNHIKNLFKSIYEKQIQKFGLTPEPNNNNIETHEIGQLIHLSNKLELKDEQHTGNQ